VDNLILLGSSSGQSRPTNAPSTFNDGSPVPEATSNPAMEEDDTEEVKVEDIPF
jgi:hypothetical protein